MVAVVGNEDGAYKIIADSFRALNDIGYTIPAQGGACWNSVVMAPRADKDLEETPDAVASATRALAANAAHPASLLRDSAYPGR